MTPEQKIKAAILKRAHDMDCIKLSEPVTVDNVDTLYEANNQDYELQDAVQAMRSGEVETGLKCDWSRHYEAKAVAAKMSDGSWVGWTYWYGGGKHGEPDTIDWMDEAYDLECKEEEKLVVVREFARKEPA